MAKEVKTLSHILLRFVTYAAFAMLPLSLLTGVLMGPVDGLAVAYGSGLVIMDGALLVVLTGKLLGLDTSSLSKGTLGALLMGKFFGVAFLIWLGIVWLELPGGGTIAGLAVGLMTLVLSLQWASTTKEAKQAIQKAERVIQEKEDIDEESR